MFYQVFSSPQLKRCAIVTYNNGIHHFPHELPNDLRISILENYEILEKSQNFIEGESSGHSSCQNENFVHSKKKKVSKQKINFSHSPLFHMKTKICLKYFVNDCS